MNFEYLSKIIFDEITPKLEQNSGLAVFAEKRAKFEGWLKVELCESLSKYFPCVTPEYSAGKNSLIDITFDNWAIELKTVNTNYSDKNAINVTRPITKNIDDIINDIKKLKGLPSSKYPNKAILFVVFPLNLEKDKKWNFHLKKISINLMQIEYKEFKFKNKISGVIYFGWAGCHY